MHMSDKVELCMPIERKGDTPDGNKEQGSDAVENRPDGDVGSGVGSVSEVQLSDKQKRICELIANNPAISAKQMSEVLSVARRTVERDLAAMQKMGVLVREGNTSAGRWVLRMKSKTEKMREDMSLVYKRRGGGGAVMQYVSTSIAAAASPFQRGATRVAGYVSRRRSRHKSIPQRCSATVHVHTFQP